MCNNEILCTYITFSIMYYIGYADSSIQIHTYIHTYIHACICVLTTYLQCQKLAAY